MRIGIFSESYEPIINGVTVCVQTLRDELCKQGHDVFIFAPAYRGFVDTYDRVFRFPSKRTIFASDYPLPVPHSAEIRDSFRKLELDVVHTQTPFLLGILGARWAKQAGIPLVSTNHTLYAEYTHYTLVLPQPVAKFVIVTLMKQYYNACDGIVAPSNMAREVLLDYGIHTPIEVITSGVNNGPHKEESNGFKKRVGIPDDARTLLYVGRLAKEKNLDMLLSAFKLIANQDDKAFLAMVGAGPYEQQLRELAGNLGVGDRLKFIGQVPRAELSSAYASADVFVWPSITETQGLAVCEALSAGVPCVAVNGGGTPECLQDGVDSFVTPNDSETFADSTLNLLGDDVLRDRMSAGALTNSVRFSTSEMARNFVEFYTTVIERSRSEKSTG
jgi:1,2-diacylglycerol 3-alpha-glucosyltransferase